VLPQTNTMTPRLLSKIKELVEAGATIVGPRPTRSPSLSGYPECDAEIRRIGAELWGDCDGDRVKERRCGLGRVIWGIEPEKILQQDGVPQDFNSSQPLRFIHRTSDEGEIYFVANLQQAAFTTVCMFRISGKTPELWWPDSGRLETAALWSENNGVTRVSIPFEPSGSVFVVFRRAVDKSDAIVLVKRNGKEVLSAIPEPPVKVVIGKALYGVLDDPARTRDVTAKVQDRVDTGEFTFLVRQISEGDDPAVNVVKTLTVEYSIEGKQYVARAIDPDWICVGRDPAKVMIDSARYGVLEDPKRTRDVRAKLQKLVDAGFTTFKVAQMAEGDDPAFGIVKTLIIDCTVDGKSIRLTGQDPDTLSFVPARMPLKAVVQIGRNDKGGIELEAVETGKYEWVSSSGKTAKAVVQVQPSLEIAGAWTVRFAAGSGAPERVTFDKLLSWSVIDDIGIKYFSGEATYSRTISIPVEMKQSGRRLYLDLGKVAVMAQVKLNGKIFPTLWKPPFIVDITDIAKTGVNELEVRVVNLWPNRLIGDEQLAEDSERNPEGTLKTWPQWLLEGKSSPAGRFTFTSWRLWKKDEKPLESGLLGPIMLRTTQIIPMVSP
ncbi:MAG: hypothetical protein GX455_14900, partial [Phycisphaerae bacterium]|nr:hypothetical protein [Phycisphaerae bacterium]